MNFGYDPSGKRIWKEQAVCETSLPASPCEFHFNGITGQRLAPFALVYGEPDLGGVRAFGYPRKTFPNFAAAHLWQATAASWNLGAFRFSGDPSTIDAGSKPNGNYGSTVINLMDCFR